MDLNRAGTDIAYQRNHKSGEDADGIGQGANYKVVQCFAPPFGSGIRHSHPNPNRMMTPGDLRAKAEKESSKDISNFESNGLRPSRSPMQNRAMGQNSWVNVVATNRPMEPSLDLKQQALKLGPWSSENKALILKHGCQQITTSGPEGEKHSQKFIYEWKPTPCPSCKIFRHKEANYPEMKPTKATNKKKWVVKESTRIKDAEVREKTRVNEQETSVIQETRELQCENTTGEWAGVQKRKIRQGMAEIEVSIFADDNNTTTIPPSAANNCLRKCSKEG
ncbi:hypothetical protein F0562_033796 [Nyssa sinensis]|uniref:Uncharacterized protein n=1 Tax=Nyssa sinensis TaxID=561372 RepID=A0A5J5AI11_9ASTE|nr:hypothetical protein F0562_033796 [Nyssa sinensis]